MECKQQNKKRVIKMSNLKKLREQKEMSKYKIAQLSGIAESQILKFEAGREIREKDIIKLVEVLDCTSDELIGIEKKK